MPRLRQSLQMDLRHRHQVAWADLQKTMPAQKNPNIQTSKKNQKSPQQAYEISTMFAEDKDSPKSPEKMPRVHRSTKRRHKHGNAHNAEKYTATDARGAAAHVATHAITNMETRRQQEQQILQENAYRNSGEARLRTLIHYRQEKREFWKTQRRHERIRCIITSAERDTITE